MVTISSFYFMWMSVSAKIMNSTKLVIPLHSLYWSIHTKDESKRRIAFAFIFGVNWLWRGGVTASFGVLLFSWWSYWSFPQTLVGQMEECCRANVRVEGQCPPHHCFSNTSPMLLQCFSNAPPMPVSFMSSFLQWERFGIQKVMIWVEWL